MGALIFAFIVMAIGMAISCYFLHLDSHVALNKSKQTSWKEHEKPEQENDNGKDFWD